VAVRTSQKVVVGVVFVAAMFMSIMDVTIVNVALPTIGRDFGVSATAVEVGLSLKCLLHGFKEMYGETPVQLLRRERLSLARRLVEEDRLPLKEVAWRVGYHHVTNFVNAFSAEYGVPPRRMGRQRAGAKTRRAPAKRPVMA